MQYEPLMMLLKCVTKNLTLKCVKKPDINGSLNCLVISAAILQHISVGISQNLQIFMKNVFQSKVLTLLRAEVSKDFGGLWFQILVTTSYLTH